MAVSMSLDTLGGLIRDKLLPDWLAERARLDEIDSWMTTDHDQPYTPRQATDEYRKLADHAPTPWLALVVTSVAQALYVDGYRSPSAASDSAAWSIWQANGMDARQIAIHRAALTYGIAYMTVLPGRSALTDALVPSMRGVSPRRMMAFYDDPAEDEWPRFALRVDRATSTGPTRRNGKYEPALITPSAGRLYDANGVHSWGVDKDRIIITASAVHNVGVCPVVRFANMLDLEGRTPGEVYPFIPVAARIDQTTFDRLLVQRFASWVVRTIAGMDPPANGETDAQAKMRLSVEQILIASDADTKFGSLPASPINGFIEAHETDVRTLAAVSQTPAHELLGQMANLSAEALAAARASLTAKVEERQHSFGEAHEQALRLAAHIANDVEGAADVTSQVRWKDTEIRSLSQAADALGKIAQMLNVPVEVLWEKIPGWTQQDVERAKALVQRGGGIEALMRELVAGQTPPQPQPVAG